MMSKFCSFLIPVLSKLQFSSPQTHTLGKSLQSNQKLSPSKVLPSKKSPAKNNLKQTSTVKSSKASPAKSKKSNKTSSGGESSSANASPEKNDDPEAKSFTSFSGNSENMNEENFPKNDGENSPNPQLEGIEIIVE